MFKKYNAMCKNGNGHIRTVLLIVAAYTLWMVIVAEKL